jgi:hypothetical protein
MYEQDEELFNKEVIKNIGNFGGCAVCDNMGKRLEKFIGLDSIKHCEKLIKRDKLKKQKKI